MNARLQKLTLWGLGIGLISGVLISLSLQDNSSSILTKGDFPAFYSAGSIISSGQTKQLYDSQLQQEVQNRFWPGLKQAYHSFAYPPHTALFFVPFSKAPPVAAKLLFTLLNIAAVIFSAFLLRTVIPCLQKKPLQAGIILLLFPPLLHGVLAGQNVGLSLLLYALCIYSLTQYPQKRGQLWTGVCLGLWLFKPHYALLSLGLLLIFKRYWVLPSFLSVAAIVYGINSSLLGFKWPLLWLEAVRTFSQQDFIANQHQMISLSNLVEIATQALQWPSYLTLAIWTLAALATILVIKKHLAKSQNTPAQALPFLLAPFLVVFSPHTLYYDLGLICLSSAKYITQKKHIIALYLISLALVLLKSSLPIQPLALLAIASLLFPS